MTTKVCTKCGKTKPLSSLENIEYPRMDWLIDVRSVLEKAAKAYSITPMGVFKGLLGRQKYYKNHNDSRQKPFLLERDSFLEWYDTQPKVCRYCGISQENLARIKDSQLRKVHRLTIDCKDNDAGYFLENMVLSCNRCNAIKGDFFTYEEMLHIGREHIAPKWAELLASTVRNQDE